MYVLFSRLLMQTSSKDTPFSGHYSFFIKNFPFSKKFFREQKKFFPSSYRALEKGKNGALKIFLSLFCLNNLFSAVKPKKVRIFAV